MDEKQYLEEKEIDLSDLLYSLATKWRSLIVVMLIGALIGVAFSLTKAVLPVEVEETRMVALHTTRQQLARQYEYIQESPLMNMDPLNAYNAHVKFVVAADVETPVVVQTYLNLLQLDDVQQRLLDSAGLDCDIRYTSEVVWASTESMNITQMVDKHITADITLPVEETLYRTAIGFTVRGKDRDTCLSMLDAIRKEIGDHTAALQAGDYPELTIMELSSDVSRLSPSGLLSSQQENNQMLTDMTEGLAEMLGDYEAEELDAYDKMYPDDVLAIMDKEIVAEDTEKQDEDDGFKSRLTRCIKYGIIMAVVGAFLWAVAFALQYILSNKVHTGEELHRVTRLPLLGVVVRPEKPRHPGNCIDKKIADMRNRSKVHPVDVNYLAATIGSRKEKNILLVREDYGEYTMQLAAELDAACDNLSSVGLVHLNAEALTKALECDGVIMLVERNTTNWSALSHEIDVCAERKIPMLGTVIIR